MIAGQLAVLKHGIEHPTCIRIEPMNRSRRDTQHFCYNIEPFYMYQLVSDDTPKLFLFHLSAVAVNVKYR